ncbi:Dihydropteroate synthase-like protein [Polychytrium aggregatum]|uniref:Dihydropteroate synthase-like protein n=1 Tax=Polychytrium aggregatum TaxID=110093 RepID=UPI0022FE13E1|nr:Dihydropteroate synthase-like protein [Polychytrium aggregatum]KAI9208723.1 Dihydropteroate synthase-like protein [Polychytrium aggregatum]
MLNPVLPTPGEDVIIVRDLKVRNIIGVDAWERERRQPLTIDIHLYSSISASGENDQLSKSISYGTISVLVTEFSEKTAYRSVEALAVGIARVCLFECGGTKVTVRVEKPRALLHAECAGVEITRSREYFEKLDALASEGSVSPAPAPTPKGELDVAGDDLIFIKNLVLNTIIGIHPWERVEKQRVVISILVHLDLQPKYLLEDHVPKMHNYRTITRTISRYVEESKFKTVEALVLSIAKICVETCHIPKVTVRVEKPSALVFASGAGIQITRDRSSFQPTASEQIQRGSGHVHTAFLAIGTNIGDRVANIESALAMLESESSVTVLDTSFLYETAPMYVTDQPMFLNAVCKVSTCLSPEALLDWLKSIEVGLGRDLKGIRNGPRPIDLDILYYDHIKMETERLVIPHPRIKEREFVLRPLCDIAPNLENPTLFRTNAQLLSLLAHANNPESISKVTPIGNTVWRWCDRTFIMGILNVTPDSFSDGGKFSSIDSALSQARVMIEGGADIIDIGGQSTRPNAVEVSEQEEIDRVVPVVEAIRKAGIEIPISVDTYRSGVALAALKAGADLINDVTGGDYDPNMVATVAKHHAPYCLMHMRGNPQTMMNLTEYENNDVVEDIKKTLGEKVSAAIKAGMRRWNVIVDPGIGFAKTAEQNFDILKKLPDLVKRGSPLHGFPSLVGPSRKGFIGAALNEKDPAKRVWGTAAACSASVAGGANVLRVHDVKEMKHVVVISDRCFTRSI